MSERGSTSEATPAQPNIVLTPEEKRVFGQLFKAADSEGLGVVTGEVAVKFFEKSGLNPRILGEIWGIADIENRGYLTPLGFSAALRLIGQAQVGQHPRPELALNPGPLPRFEGVNINYPSSVPPTTSSPPPPHIAQQATGVRVPQLTDADCKKFTELFQASGAVDGVLPGDAAKQIFTKAKLPNVTLGLIWNLADRQQKGALTCPEFVVAMHLINCTKNGSLQALPSALPSGLYEAASGRRPPPDRRPPGKAIPPNIPNAPPLPKQFSGGRAQSPLARQFTPPGPLNPTVTGVTPQQTGGEWAISPREKAEFDNLFASVDRDGKGYITGEEAVPFFSNSKLPEDVLATIWDLADITKAGRLTQDEFAIAMYLIRQQRARRDGKGLPETLPPNLIPPSMRAQLTGNNLPPSNFYNAPPPPAPQPASSSLDDLFGLDSFGAASSTTTTNVPQASGQAFGGFDASFQGPVTTSTTATQPSASSTMFSIQQQHKFVPTSEFGQMLAATATGGSTTSLPRPAPPSMDDLLGDNDPEVNRKITSDTMELANLSNQIGTLTKQTQELKNKRTSTEQELNTINTQKQDIEARLSQIKSLYEREAQDVKAVEERLVAARNDVIRMRQEYAILESSYNELHTKKQEIVSQLEEDQRENKELKEKMKVVNAENQQLKEQLEKLRLEAKQQKGLATISKKQLATSEAERDKLKSEIDDFKSAAAVAASSQVVSPTPGSPTPSQASLNPFFRGRSPPATDSPYQSPYATGNSNFASQQQQQQSPQVNFDDVFGPSFGSPSAGQPPPTTFNQTVQSVTSAPSASEGPFDHSTPPTSPPASSYHNSPQTSDVPPPPSAASQITSAYLPIQVSRAESVTSSVQVNPPASTHDGSFSRPDTPTTWMNAPSTFDSPAKGSDIFAKSEERRPSTSVRSDPGTEFRVPGFSRSEDNKSPFSPVTLAKNLTGPTTSAEDDLRKGHEKKDSFGFTSPTPNLSTLPGAFPSPIKPTATGESTRSNKSRGSTMSRPEVTFATRSDPFSLNTVEERAPTASKDDMEAAFASFGSPKTHVQERQNTGGSSMSAKIDKEFPPIHFPQDDESDSDTGGFEDNFTTSSPVETRSGLVPPTTSAPPEGTETASKPGTPLPAIQNSGSDSNPFPHSQEFTAGFGSNILENLGAQSKSPPVQASMFPAPPPAKPAKAPVDEFDDDAFGDLTDAKEVDGKGDHDDFGVLAAHDGFDDFNPVFDSPVPKASNLPTTKNAQSTEDDDFTKFDFNIDTPALAQLQQNTGATTGGSALQPASSQDWDAIFAGSNDSKQPPTTAAPGVPENTANAPAAGEGVVGGSQSGTGPVSTSLGNTDKETCEHEEKLTKLTGMGFSRESSLNALEKFNYNVESATNYLLDNQAQ
ncbi:hypothetical protein BDZ91DRAFT_690031 [Kalaharituber pfeilii]|nr:hypothetical protein BDZ91DRAFT_690031 [Kalaharituber pfeilii]